MRDVWKLNRSTLFFPAAVLTYVLLFWKVYRESVSPVFAYWGMTYEPIAPIYAVLLLVYAVAPSLWAPKRLERPSQLLYWGIYLLVFIPSCIIPIHTLNVPTGDAFTMMSVLLANMFLLSLIYRVKLFRLPRVVISPKVFWVVVAAFSVVSYAVVLVVFRGQMQFVSLYEVYGLRSEFKDTVEQAGVAAYFLFLQSYAVNSFIMARGLFTGRWTLFGVGAVGQLLLYTVGGHKAIVFSIILIAALWFISRRESDRDTFFGRFVLLFVAFFAMYVAIDVTFGAVITDFLRSFIVNRMFAVPGLMSGLYVDYFVVNDVTWFSHIRGVNWFVDYPYEYPIPSLIGYQYYGRDDLYANAHIWADGFAGMQWAGMFIVTFIAAALFWIYDSAMRNVDVRYAALTISFYVVVLTNASLFTAMLSFGMGLSMLMTYLNRVPNQKRNQESWAVESVR